MELKRLYLTSSERGQKFGNYLLNYAINFATQNRYRCIRLEAVSKFEEAVSLYKKHGFIELKKIKKVPGHDLAFEKILEFLPFSPAETVPSTLRNSRSTIQLGI